MNPTSRYANLFYVMRHGNSMANQAKIVVSDPKNGVDQYGLSDLGIQQVNASVAGNNDLNAETIIYCSDFARARETAELVRTGIKAGPINLSKRLRERFFGEYELGPDSIYDEVWLRDQVNPNQSERGVESVNSVTHRASELLKSLDLTYENKTILIVAHGDILQILLTFCAGLNPGEHRSVQHLDTAEIRRLV